MRGEMSLEAQAPADDILLVRLFSCIFIGKVSVGMVVIDSGREADLLAQKAVVRSLGFDLPVVSRR